MYVVGHVTVNTPSRLFPGSLSFLFCPALSNPAAEPGVTVRYLALLCALAHTHCPSSGDWSQVSLQGEGLMGLLPVLLLCVAAGVFQMLLKKWVLSSFPCTESSRKLPCGHLSPGTVAISFIFSFFSLHTYSRDSAT